MKTRSVSIALLLTVPIVLVFDPASTLSLRNFLGDILGLLYLLFRGIQKLWQKRRKDVERED